MQENLIGKMDKLIVHYVGNKNDGDGVRLSNSTTHFENIEQYFDLLISNSFKFEELFCFHFLPSLELNPVYQFVKTIFGDPSSFVEQTQHCAKILYDKSDHPKIKGGELQIAYYKGCPIDGKIVDAIGFFKSENKETFLKVITSNVGFDLERETGIALNKLDKGCFVFNIREESGYLLSIVDNTNRGSDAQYWKDEFLGVQPVKNEFHQTNQFLDITKNFVTKHLSEEFDVSKPDKIDLLNRSVGYFKSHENFDKQEFENEVLQNSEIIKSFNKFDAVFRNSNDIDLADNFEISPHAVKKQARVFKSILKLDKNFHIYIHGDRDLIEQGIEKDGRKYYKIYYKDES